MPQNELSEESIFALALEKPSPAERAAFVEGACAGNPTLRERVEGLLRSHTEAGSFLQQPLAPATETFGPDRIAEGPGTRIGPYRLLQQIGEGGMGVVYMAEQEHPVRRKIALKIIKPGMDSAQVVARFEAERQALALMDHQNIAKVLDAGATEHGRPFFVMELVKGVPITEYCDSNQLSPRERLAMFVPICRAIQHAHQKGVIHRDIKPSNVLVSLYDGVPVPKVIDFGVAKATDQRLTERTMFTQHGAILGTLEYMSPEQAENSALDIDTRSDVYSLGVLLYELLTGSTPLERTTLRQAGYAEILRRIKEEEPPRPSNRVSASRQALASISAQRKTEPSKLAGLVRGELDWIVMKALEKNRSRRYETAVGFARDIERYLNDEAVEACPPSGGYRLRKFASKHRAALAMASTFAALLLLGAIVSTWQAIRARQAEDRAIREAERARRAEAQTGTERDKALSAERETEAKRIEAELARQSLRRSLYTSDIQRAQTAWESGNVGGMLDLLDGQRPEPGQADLRGFEWHYLARQGSILRTTEVAPGSDFVALSPDGTRCVVGYAKTDVESADAEHQQEFKIFNVNSLDEMRTLVTPFGGRYRWPLQFGPDSKHLAIQSVFRDRAGKRDSWVRIWDCETGSESGGVTGLSITPLSKALDRQAELLALGFNRPAAEGGGCELKVWQIKGAKQIHALAIPGRAISGSQAVAFSPDRMYLAAITRPSRAIDVAGVGEVHIWEASSGKEVLKFAAGPGSVCLAYSPDGQFLATGSGGGASNRIWEARSGREVLELAGGSAVDESDVWPMIAFSPDGSRLAWVAPSSKLRIWDLTDPGGGRRHPEIAVGGSSLRLEHPAWSADGRSVSAVAFGGIVATWQVPPRGERVVIRGPVKGAYINATAALDASRFAATFEAAQRKLAVKAWDRTGKIFFTADEDLAANTLLFTKLRFSRDGNRLALLAWTRDREFRIQSSRVRLRVWDLPTGRVLLHREGDVSVAALSPDGRLIALSNFAFAVEDLKNRVPVMDLSLWDLDSGRELLRFELPGASDRVGVLGLTFSPDGRRLAGSFGGTAGALRVWDTASGKAILTRNFTKVCHGDPAYSVDGRWLAVSRGAVLEAAVIEVVDASSGETKRSLVGHRSEIEKLVFSPDCRRLASLAMSGPRPAEIKLWDVAGGEELLALQGKYGGIWNDGLAFSPDGHLLSYISEARSLRSDGGKREDAQVQVWDATPLPSGQRKATGVR